MSVFNDLGISNVTPADFHKEFSEFVGHDLYWQIMFMETTWPNLHRFIKQIKETKQWVIFLLGSKIIKKELKKIEEFNKTHNTKLRTFLIKNLETILEKVLELEWSDNVLDKQIKSMLDRSPQLRLTSVPIKQILKLFLIWRHILDVYTILRIFKLSDIKNVFIHAGNAHIVFIRNVLKQINFITAITITDPTTITDSTIVRNPSDNYGKETCICFEKGLLGTFKLV